MGAPVEDDELIELIRVMSELLSSAGEPVWAQRLMTIAGVMAAARGDRDRRQTAIRRILELYRSGMGGFQDLVLQDCHGIREEQQEFGRLRSRLFEEARARLG